ncbi:hypothetical protein [Parafilimonas terrae]|uniref:Uncharacterized protein n=1 Tax=Parafilimonas terrae TaxID=1465490 RepID=A0A1I5SMY5_9BACT|nr:hypothetical protein [Parafilimonas terrae]SFP72110.1 hypothetical protein SAMN05444277_101851 [Parafilimonas terrae]
MKHETSNSKVYLDHEELNTLVTQVKETVAAGINNEVKNTFSAADLWNIQRMKTRIQRRTTLWN